MLDELSDDQIKYLIAAHWREIRGLAKELQRRRTTVSDTDEEPLDSGHRDGWAAG